MASILVVDDRHEHRDLAVNMLEWLGYRVEALSSGEEAIDYLRSREADLVILDMIMPQMGGGRVFDAMQGINPDVKVLLASGYSLNGQASNILSRGCFGFIQKPFSIIDLSKKIREILGPQAETRAVA